MVTVATLTALIAQYLPEPHAGLLAGISFGAKSAMSQDLSEALIRTGTIHIVALSGMNISIVSGMVSYALLRLVSRRIASLLTVLLIIGFVWFVGPSASVVRAAIMGTISLAAVILGRSNWPILSWLLAVGLMLLLNPSWIADLSFQLSALATLGIILFGGAKSYRSGVTEVAHKNLDPSSVSLVEGSHTSIKVNVHSQSEAGQNFVSSPQRRQLNPVKYFVSIFWSFIADDLRVTLAAQVFTIPVILLNFHRISLISPLPNILIGSLIGPLTILGWLVGFSGLVSDPLGQVVAWVAWVPLQYVLWVVATTSRLPFASLSF